MNAVDANRFVVVSPNTTVPPAFGGPFHICTRATLNVLVVVDPVWYPNSVTVLIVACDKRLYAVEDRCPQTARSIAHSEVLRCVITTPTGARYSLETGQYLGGGELPVQLPSHWLTLYPLKVIEGKVYVHVPGA